MTIKLTKDTSTERDPYIWTVKSQPYLGNCCLFTVGTSHEERLRIDIRQCVTTLTMLKSIDARLRRRLLTLSRNCWNQLVLVVILTV